ncbi:MAG: hypothetical protein GY940_25960, partial [bacterium]|nr:hypothetical protein [bacterium]
LYYDFKAVPQKIMENKGGHSRMLFSFKGWRAISEGITGDIASREKNTPIFAIHGGDMVLNGFQGRMFNPYWMLFNSFYGSLRAYEPGTMPRFFPVVGNHELWEDENLTGFRYWFPWLEKYGFSETNRVYHLVHQNSLFVFLDTGDYALSGGTQWLSKLPPFQGQMDFLKKQLENVPESVQHVFVVYHKPSFAKVGHDPLPKDQNPHYAVLKNYADKFNIIVFNSHVHSTEYYIVDGIRYLLVGGGGAPQAFKPAKHPSPEKELYWNGKPLEFQLNYMTVHVKGKKVSVDVNKFNPPAFKREKPVTLFTIK